MKKEDIYQKEITCSYSDIGPFGDLKITAVMNLLQDAGAEHSDRLNISGLDLAKKNFFWVISKYRITINQPPGLNERLKISTWRRSLNNLYDLRWFKVENSKKEDIIDAVGAWVMVNKTTGMPCRLSRFFPESLLCRENQNKIDQHFQKLDRVSTTDLTHSFKIRMHDLDLNRHVNNAVYIEWAVETVPEKMHATHRPEKIDVDFFKESFYPDKISSNTEIKDYKDKPLTCHSIRKKEENEELACINISWKRLEKR